jgi:hypothetical protein
VSGVHAEKVSTIVKEGASLMTHVPFRIAILTATTLVAATSARAGAPATPLAPSKASQLVSLLAPADAPPTCPSLGIPFQQLGMNGVRTPFEIPPSTVLIITAIHFSVFQGSPSTNSSATITSEMAGDEFRLPLAVGTALLDARGEGGGMILIPTGVRVPAGRTVCILPGGGLTGALLFGFLAPDN